MVQGMGSSPFDFSKICREIAGFLRERNILVVFYLDDVTIVRHDDKHCLESTKFVMPTLTKCGFILNKDKSCVTPSQTREVLGFMIDTVHQTISLTHSK